MFLFDTLVKSVLLYGVEIWGWREEEVVERIQERYIRWVLELDTCTPGYIVREEAKRDKMRVDTGSRAWRYEMKVRKNENNNILLSNCTKELSKNRETALKGWMKRRTNYFWRNGWSVEEIERMEQAGIDSEKELKKRDKTSIETEQYNRLQEAKYNTWYKYIKTTELPRYLDRRGRKENQSLIGRWRCGNEERGNMYWLAEEKTMCRICGEKKESINHLREECRLELRTREEIAELLGEEGKGEEWMRRVDQYRRKEEIE